MKIKILLAVVLTSPFWLGAYILPCIWAYLLYSGTYLIACTQGLITLPANVYNAFLAGVNHVK